VATFAGKLPTITGYYDLENYSELDYARIVKQNIGGDYKSYHIIVKITPRDFIYHFDDMVNSIDPFQVGPGVFGQWMVAARASVHGIKTLLSGEGGDELFGGYARLMAVAGAEMPEGYENYTPPADYPDNLKDALQYDWDKLPVLMAADEQIFNAWNITVTPPLMDARVVDFAMNLPPEQRVGKKLLRAAVRGFVPDAIIDRKDKKGFPTPFVYWAQEEPVKSFVLERIGYIPDVNEPYARAWWYDLCKASKERITA
jgi:asparagine synthetase B (glutamine-hydrolysing)